MSGLRGSGAVFFSRCTLRCRYCQNYPWSQEGRGELLGIAELESVFRELHAAGCHNWNLVSPTPWLPMIRDALNRVRRTGVSLPVVYNTSGFENGSVLRAFPELADIVLVDLRYASAALAAAMSGAGGYVAAARQFVRAAWKRVGPLVLDGEGIAVSGVIVRILILPGHVREAVASLQWLRKSLGDEVAVSVMSQYTPAHRVLRTAPWNRRIIAAEAAAVAEAVDDLGFQTGWTQAFSAATRPELVGFDMPPGAQCRAEEQTAAGLSTTVHASGGHDP